MKDSALNILLYYSCSFFVTKERTKKVPRLGGFSRFAADAARYATISITTTKIRNSLRSGSIFAVVL